MNIEKEELLDMLKKAYMSGFEGYKEFENEVCEEITNEFYEKKIKETNLHNKDYMIAKRFEDSTFRQENMSSLPPSWASALIDGRATISDATFGFLNQDINSTGGSFTSQTHSNNSI